MAVGAGVIEDVCTGAPLSLAARVWCLLIVHDVVKAVVV